LEDSAPYIISDTNSQQMSAPLPPNEQSHLDALRKSEARFKELFDQAPVGYHELDVNARIVSVNQTELSMLGYQESEMIGRPVWDVMVEKEECKISVFGKLREEIPVGSIERTFVRKDGSHFQGMITDVL